MEAWLTPNRILTPDIAEHFSGFTESDVTAPG
jgi:hypothetical protein